MIFILNLLWFLIMRMVKLKQLIIICLCRKKMNINNNPSLVEFSNKEFQQNQEIDIVARTLWGEARNQGMKGMIAVANVIGNRVNNPGWWGYGYISVCFMKNQFSCWNRNDPNYSEIRKVDPSDKQFFQAINIATNLVKNKLKDLTLGSDHYLLTNVVHKIPWAQKRVPQVIIGKHSFYKCGLFG